MIAEILRIISPSCGWKVRDWVEKYAQKGPLWIFDVTDLIWEADRRLNLPEEDYSAVAAISLLSIVTGGDPDNFVNNVVPRMLVCAHFYRGKWSRVSSVRRFLLRMDQIRKRDQNAFD